MNLNSNWMKDLRTEGLSPHVRAADPPGQPVDGKDPKRGSVMDLTTLWRLTEAWYTGRLARGYTRREPAAAADYFREVGLEGPFWGL